MPAVGHGDEIGASNTGRAGASAAGLTSGVLTDHDGPDTITVDGTVIENRRITGA